jgi:hypothetical protein
VLCDVGVGLQIIEEITQRRSVIRSNCNGGKMHRGGPNKLGHIFGDLIFDRLCRSLG